MFLCQLNVDDFNTYLVFSLPMKSYLSFHEDTRDFSVRNYKPFVLFVESFMMFADNSLLRQRLENIPGYCWCDSSTLNPNHHDPHPLRPLEIYWRNFFNHCIFLISAFGFDVHITTIIKFANIKPAKHFWIKVD